MAENNLSSAAPPGLRSVLRAQGGWLAGLAILLWVYFPVWQGKYGYNDDYLIFEKVASHTFSVTDNVAITQGRPLTGLALQIMFSAARTIDELRFGRLFSIAGILLLALSAREIFRRNNFSPAFSTSTALLIALSPGLVVCGAWLTAGSIPYAGTLALIGGSLLAEGIAVGRFAPSSIWKTGAAILLLLAAYATYQPAAGLALVACLASILREEKTTFKAARNLFLAVGVLLLVAAFYLLLYKGCARFFPAGGQAERAAFSGDLLSGLRFASGTILWSALAGWTRFHPLWLQWLSVIGTLLLLSRSWRWRREIQPLAIGVTLLAVAFGLLPFLLLREQHDNFRTQIALQATLVFLAMRGLQIWSRRWPGAIFAWLLVVASALLARDHLVHDFIAPNTREIGRLRREVARLPAEPHTVVFFSPAPTWVDGRNVGEFRDLSCPEWWNTPAMLRLLLKERFPASQAPEKITPLQVLAAQGHLGEFPIIDGFRALERDTRRATHPQIGKIRKTAGGWCVSSWFGVFYDRQDGFIRSPVFGWMHCTGKGPDDLWLWTQKLGWFWTSQNLYPQVYLADKKSWTQLVPTVGQPEP